MRARPGRVWRVLVALAPVLLVTALLSETSALAVAKPSGAQQSTKRLPLRAAPVSTRTGDNVGTLRLTLRPAKRARLGPVRIAFKSHAGKVLSRLRVAEPNATEMVVALPLKQALRPGKYSIRLVGRRASGSKLLSVTWPVAFAEGGGWAKPAATTTGVMVQKVVVDWNDGKWQGRDLSGFVAPGIGYGEVVCRPDAQMVRFYPSLGGRETAMMNWTYKDWGTYREKSLREALYTTGTGLDFNEGLNKFGPPEKNSTGTFEGVISDRGPIGGPGGVLLAPPTTLSLSWEWDFNDPASSRCHIEAVFRTETTETVPPLARSVQVVWRDEANAAANGVGSVDFPGLGAVTVTCRPGDPRHLTVGSPGGATIVTREGSEDNALRETAGPIVAALPNNGMVLIEMNSGERILVSSRWKLNDPIPSRNWCAISAQVLS